MSMTITDVQKRQASPNVRLATITRLRHKDTDKIGKDAYTDIWREWSGVRDVLR